MKNMKKFASLGLSLVMMLSLAACGGSKTPAASGSAAPAGSADGSAAAAESDLEYVKGKGKLVVGITDFAPMDYKDKVLPAMADLRKTADALETMTAAEYWPYPSYGDILFSVR